MTSPHRRWVGLLLGLAAGVLLTGCTLTGQRGATIHTPAAPAGGEASADCPPATVTGTAPGLDPAQAANAKTVVSVAVGRGLGPTAAEIAVAAALAESSLYNYANDGTSTLIGSAERRQLTPAERAVARESLNYPHDKIGNNLDSIGLFQQRPMTGWGTPAELIDPATATGKFLDRMITIAGWQTLSPWAVAQSVQGSPSSDGGIYRDSHQRAIAIVAALDTPTTLPDTTTRGVTDAPSAIVVQAAAGSNCGRPATAGGGSAAWGGHQNGRIPAGALCPVPSAPALRLECAAAAAYDRLNTAFKTVFGRDIGITDGYRSYAEQVACRLAKGGLCADPGTSNHGWGKAVDIGGCCAVNTGTGSAFDWLTSNAGRYGWTHPAWAQPGGSKTEPWHWEYGAI